jgi:hypothetical protein
MSDDGTAPERDELAARVEAHGIRLAILKYQAAKAKKAYDVASQRAYPDFAAARNKGIPQVKPRFPDGSEPGLFSLLSGGQDVDVDEDLLLSIIAVGSPADLEDYVLPAAFADERVVELIGAHFPEFVTVRIKPAVRAELQAQIEEKNGHIADPATGELEKVATVTPRDASGQFQFRADARFEQMLTAALEAGQITPDGTIKEDGSEQ